LNLILVLTILFLGITLFLFYFGKMGISNLSVLTWLTPKPWVVTTITTDNLDTPNFLRSSKDGQHLVGYFGEAEIPSKVYEDDSCNLKIHLQPKLPASEMFSNPIQITQSEKGKELTVQFLDDGKLDQFLECEIVSTGIQVDGNKTQRHKLDASSLDYLWNCYFPNSGRHAIAIILRVTSQTDSIDLGIIEHTIRVVKLDHLTKRQVWLFTVISGILTGGLALAETLIRLGLK
jgi:hypothetical protein